jgi:syntaxin 1B/2/3
MAPLAQNAGGFSRNADPNAILNECRDIDQGIDEIERNLNQLRMLQDRSLNDTDTSAGSATSRQLDGLSSETMGLYRGLTERVRAVKSDSESRQAKNTAQVGRVDRRLKSAIQQYQQVESAFRKRTQDQMARQYRIVRPDASEQEVRAAVEDTSQGAQVFQQALMQSDRRGQARAVLSAVQDRHAAIQKIEQQMIELAQLFQDMDTLVVQQEEQVLKVEDQAAGVVQDLDKGNVELGGAVKSARGARRKKWICLGICGAYPFPLFPLISVNDKANTHTSHSRHYHHHRHCRGRVRRGQQQEQRQQEAQPRHPRHRLGRRREARDRDLRAVQDRHPRSGLQARRSRRRASAAVEVRRRPGGVRQGASAAAVRRVVAR